MSSDGETFNEYLARMAVLIAKSVVRSRANGFSEWASEDEARIISIAEQLEQRGAY